MFLSSGPITVVQAEEETKELTSPVTMVSNNLQVDVTFTNSGLRVTRLYDALNSKDLLSTNTNRPIFTIYLDGATLESTSGWSSVKASLNGSIYTYVFSGNSKAPGVTVTITVDTGTADTMKWKIQIDNDSNKTVRDIKFPQLFIRNLGPNGKVFYPEQAGKVYDLWTTGMGFGATYPSCQATMPYVAAYNGETGIYFGMHDPNVDIVIPYADGLKETNEVELGFETSAPDYTKPGNDYNREAQAYLQLTTDWYDAAMIYRNWVENNATWWPEIDENGRVDTPDWYKKLNVWTKTENWSGETPDDTTRLVKAFQEYMGMPVGNHWYRWHHCLMDGDFPEYFPPVDGFEENVIEQQNNNIYVMPYVNGRLWESQIASFDEEGGRAAACKDKNGNLYTGAFDVPTGALATMCPTQKVWQDKVKWFTNEMLFDTYHVNGVYEDMVAYSAVDRCFDANHGHTLYGGDYWQKGYQDMFKVIRNLKPKDGILCSEGPADAYSNIFDGILAYVISDGGMEVVPALHAVLANATQLMGRYYSSSESDVTWKQKNGRAFVWGEQLGWCDADIMNFPSKASYLRNTAKVRDQINRAIYAGKMGRPLKLEGNSTVTGQEITTNIIENGVWMLPQDNKVVVLFTNVSDENWTVKVNMNLSDYGMNAGNLRIVEKGPNGDIGEFTSENTISRSLTLAASEVRAWEITPGTESTTKKILVLSTHPGNEILTTAGIIEQGITEGKEVKVAVVTNGDSTAGSGDYSVGQKRINESIAACTYLGMDADDLMFLGYGENTIQSLYTAETDDTVISSSVGTKTYGTDGKPDYHSQRFGEAASYTRANLIQDIETIIKEYRPDDIYITSLYDTNSDNSYFYLFTLETLLKIKKQDPSYSPKMHEAVIHSSNDAAWPVRDAVDAPMTTFTKPNITAVGPALDWDIRESISVPDDMKVVPRDNNKKYNAIKLLESVADEFSLAFVKSDEVFWVKDFSNIAPLATITQSSEASQWEQYGKNVADGIADGNSYYSSRFTNKEWSSQRETVGAWIQLTWSEPQTIDCIKLYDRVTDWEQIKGGILTFSDGSTIEVGELPNLGYAKVINFTPKTVEWVKFTVTAVSEHSTNIGLAEFEVYPYISKNDSPDTPDKSLYEEAGKYANSAIINGLTEAGTDVTNIVAKMVDGKTADPSINVSYSVSPGTYLETDGTSVKLKAQKTTEGNAYEFVTITFTKNGQSVTKEVFVTIKTSHVKIVLLKDAYRSQYLYDNNGQVAAKRDINIYDKKAHWIIEDMDTHVMIKNVGTGNYIADLNGKEYFECLPLDESHIENFGFHMTKSYLGLVFVNVKTSAYINVENDKGYAETLKEPYVDANCWSAMYITTTVDADTDLQYLRNEAAKYAHIATISNSSAIGTDVTSTIVQSADGSTDPEVALSYSVSPGEYLEVKDGSIIVKAKNKTGNYAIETVKITFSRNGKSVTKDVSVAVKPETEKETSKKKILYIAPHPDDEALSAAGVIARAVTDGNEVKVVVVTNGDYYGSNMAKVRIGESVDACTYLGMDEDDIIFMGYGDSTISGLYNAETDTTVVPSNAGESTYGTNEHPDYHFDRFGEHAAYTRASIRQDLETIINEYRPDDIYTTSIYDTHSDHQYVGLFVIETIINVKKQDPSYSPKMHEALIHAPDGEDKWPLRDKIDDPMTAFSRPEKLASNIPQLKWEDREIVNVPEDMMVVPRTQNKKYIAISKYKSQECDYNYAFVKSDEVFWVRDFSNIAPLAAVTASSENTQYKQLAKSAVDGIADGNPRYTSKEWVSKGERAGAWIQLDWSEYYTIDRIRLYDRVTLGENITGATLTFSDGSSIKVDALPQDGSAKEITFPAKTVNWVRLTIDSTNPECYNIGLSEIEVYPASNTSVDKTALAAKVAEAEALKETDYTAETWAVLADALKAAKEVLAQAEATQEDVDNALTALVVAIAGLKEKDAGQSRPFTIVPAEKLDRTAGIKAEVAVTCANNAGDHSGNEVVIFQLIKDNTPVSIVAVERDIAGEEIFTAYFNVIDPQNSGYKVMVFVFDRFDSDVTAPINLADPVTMK